MKAILILLIISISIIFSLIVKRSKKFGSYEIKDDILKIKSLNSEDRILFNDISSINNMVIKKPNFLFLSLSLLSIIFPLIIHKILLATISIVLCFIFKIKWDQISVESSGGKIIKLNVKKGLGSAIAEKIENYKRTLNKVS